MSILDELLEEVDTFFRPNLQYNKVILRELNPKYTPNINEQKETASKCQEMYEDTKGLVKKTYELVSAKRKTPTEIRILKAKPKEVKDDQMKKIIESRKKDIQDLIERKINSKKLLDDNFHEHDVSKGARKKATKIMNKYIRKIKELQNDKWLKFQPKKFEKLLSKTINRFAEKLAKLQSKEHEFIRSGMESIDKYYEKKLKQTGGNISCPTIHGIKTQLVPKLHSVLDEYIDALADESHVYETVLKKLTSIDPDEIDDEVMLEMKTLTKKMADMKIELDNLLRLKVELKEEFLDFEEAIKLVLGGKRRKKKSKKSKKIRKHKGINQETGRLKKGYKYSGKKLKTGLPQIIKIKK